VSENPKAVKVAFFTTFGVDAGGVCAELNGRDVCGEPVRFVLPTACLTQLLMTLPAMLQQALQKRSGDDSKRVVYPLDHWRLERGERGPAGEQLYILTVGTEDEFKVSFVSAAETLTDIARSIFGGVVYREPALKEPRPRLS